jgi:hypothetical protein
MIDYKTINSKEDLVGQLNAMIDLACKWHRNRKDFAARKDFATAHGVSDNQMEYIIQRQEMAYNALLLLNDTSFIKLWRDEYIRHDDASQIAVKFNLHNWLRIPLNAALCGDLQGVRKSYRAQAKQMAKEAKVKAGLPDYSTENDEMAVRDMHTPIKRMPAYTAPSYGNSWGIV